jgi:hypothetical protein
MKQLSITFLVMLLLSVTGRIIAQNTGEKLADSILNDRGEVYLRFSVKDKEQIRELTRIISIDNVRESEVTAYANRREFARFLEQGIPYNILPAPGTLLTDRDLNMGNIQQDRNSRTIWNFYPTYQQYLDLMYGFASSHSSICRLDTIGTTTQGRLLLAVKISDSVNYDRGVPQFFYTSSIHGDELTGYVCMLHLIDSLLSGYNSNPRITSLVHNCQVFINPLANPDGTYHGGNSTVNGATRGNANSIDLNRNFPDPAEGPHPDGNSWQPETVAFMSFADSTHFSMSMNFHGGAEVYNYPWDNFIWLHPDDAWWQLTGREYADTNQAYGPNNYFDDLNDGITNGYAWYPVSGGRQDYTSWFRHGREVTCEISATKTPQANQLLNYWNYNRRSFLNYMEEVTYGINGTVSDSMTGQPVRAKVFINSHDADSTFVYSNLPSGWYFRPVYAGTYTIRFSAPGYLSRTISGVTVVNRAATRLNVKLKPGTDDPATFPFFEDFNASSVNLPSGWSQEVTGTGATNKWSVSTTTYAGGTGNEMKSTYQNVNPGTTRLKTFAFSTVGVTTLTLSFRYLLDDYNPGATLKVQSSADGISWTDEGWSLATSSNSNKGPFTQSVSITHNLNSPSTIIAFVITGNLYQYDYWYIDDVSIKAPGYWAGGTAGTPLDWNTASNWGDGLVPGVTTNVYIPSRNSLPVVNNDPSSPAQCNDLTIGQNASVTINPGKKLNVNGKMTIKSGMK